MTSARLSADIFERLGAAIRTVVGDTHVQAKFVQRGQEPQTSTPEALSAMLRDERAQRERFIADQGLKPK